MSSVTTNSFSAEQLLNQKLPSCTDVVLPQMQDFVLFPTENEVSVESLNVFEAMTFDKIHTVQSPIQSLHQGLRLF